MKYLLTIQAEFEADDDPSARSVIKNKLLEKITILRDKTNTYYHVTYSTFA